MNELNFPSAEAICRIKDPLTWTKEKNQLMVEACRELATFHYHHNKDIAFLYDRHTFKPNEIAHESDLEKIPVLGVTAMKYHLLTSLPHDQVVLRLTSSGTRGQKTQIWFDQASLDRCQAMLEEYWRQEGFITSEKQNYVLFGYSPEDAKNLGIAFADENQMRFAPKAHVTHALKMREGSWYFDRENLLREFERCQESAHPTRIFGMPAFIHEFLLFLKEKGKSYRLHPDSLIMTGGGWKAAEDQRITRELFREECAHHFQVSTDRMRDGYGMAEHCAPYNECRAHRFHIPVYTRVIVRDPVTMQVLSPGEEGLLELVTPFNAMMPNLTLLTTDWGKIDSDPCPCGFESPTFQILGRAGITKHKGCALHADEIVKRRL